ncbi:hypothetical protein JCM18909_49 [Cutibacterium acnes JCM 18909]|nr:hypothetical protein JCM18909_49 [Cutibacterium acnes JCM 18909]
MGLSVLSMAIMVLAFAQPKAYHEVPRDRATVVVAIDVSRSMVATDVEPLDFPLLRLLRRISWGICRHGSMFPW